MLAPNVTRRAFLQTVCFGMALSRGAGATTQEPVLIRAEDPFGIGTLLVRLSEHPTLQQDLGSVRIGTSPQAGRYPAGLFYPVLINRLAGGNFVALNARCPHEGCTVPPLDAAAQLHQCPCHFSRFRADGSFIEGPARAPLTRYQLVVKGDFLLVEIPELPFKLTVEKVPVGRLALEFLAFEAIRYEVHYRSSFESPPEVVPFSTTAAGSFNQAVFPGNDDLVRVYVPMPAELNGFYSVAMQTRQV